MRVPRDNLVGELNGGWALITNQLNHERVALTSAAPSRTRSPEVARVGRRPPSSPTARRVIDPSGCRCTSAARTPSADMLKLLNWQLASAADDLAPADASATKVYGTELATEVYRLLMEVVGAERRSSPAARRAPCCAAGSSGYYRSSLIMTFGGGTNEIQRDIIG